MSCFCGSGLAAVHRVRPLLSTRRDASRHRPRCRERAPNEWKSGQSKVRRPKHAPDVGYRRRSGSRQRYGWAVGLSTRDPVQEFHHFDRLFALPSRMIGRLSRRSPSAPSPRQGFSMTTLVPGNENRPALRPRLRGRDRLPAALAGRPAGSRAGRQPGAGQGQRRGDPPERPRRWPKKSWRPASPRWTRPPSKENVLAFLIDMKIVAKAAEDKKVAERRRLQEAARLRPQPHPDGSACWRSKARPPTTDEAMKKVYEDAAKQIAGEPEVHARHILVETEDEAKAVGRGAEEGRRFRRTGEEEVQGSRRLRWRRPRLLHQGPDGAGILRRRLRAGARQDLRAGEVAVRLARHQGRGKAQPQGARLRAGEGPDRDLCDAARRRPNTSPSCARAAKVERLDKPAEPAKADDAKPADDEVGRRKPADSKMAPAKK